MSEGSVCLAALRVPQLADSECTVLIWRSGWFYKALQRSGHAALLLRRERNEGPWAVQAGEVPAYDDEQVRYVSFNPVQQPRSLLSRFRACKGRFAPHHLVDYATELGDSALCRLRHGAKPRPGQICIEDKSGRDPGEKIWGRVYDQTVSLAALTPLQPHRLGLDLNRIIASVNRFKAGDDFQYRYVSHSNNCAAIACRGLVAGGGAAFLRLGAANWVGRLCFPPFFGRLYLTPNTVLRYARQIERGINHANRMLSAIEAQAVGSAIAGSTTEELDDRTAGGELAGLIRRFRNLQWQKDLTNKLGLLIAILRQTYDDLQRGPDAAVLRKARLMLSAVEELTADAAASWEPQLHYGDVRLPDLPGAAALRSSRQPART